MPGNTTVPISTTVSFTAATNQAPAYWTITQDVIEVPKSPDPAPYLYKLDFGTAQKFSFLSVSILVQWPDATDRWNTYVSTVGAHDKCLFSQDGITLEFKSLTASELNLSITNDNSTEKSIYVSILLALKDNWDSTYIATSPDPQLVLKPR